MSHSRQNRRQLYEQLVGQTVADRYKIAGLMGFGGMGAVYEAVDGNMQRRVALKYIPSHDPVTTERFKREALTVSNLHHRNTVTVFDRGETDDGFLFLSMELLDGRTLTDLIKKDSPLAPGRVVHIASQICGSLAEAHNMGIVHRDVKPDNVILIDDDGDPNFVKVLDFGIAKAVSREEEVTLTGDGRIVGTPRYMSPEQILSESIDHRSDIYSLGCIIFEMLCGAPPFKAPSTTALMISHAQDPPPPFAERLTEVQLDAIPLGLEHVVRRAMSKDPDNRPQTTDELRAELEEALQAHKAGRPASVTAPPEGLSGPPVVSHDPAHAPAVAPSSNSTSALVIGIAIVAVIISTAAAAFVVFDSDDEPDETEAIAEPVQQAPENATPPSQRVQKEIHDSSSNSPRPVSISNTIHVRIDSDPTGASVEEDGEEIGETPFNISVSDRTDFLNYLLIKDNYKDFEVVVEIDTDEGERQEFLFELERDRPARAARPRRRAPAPEPAEEVDDSSSSGPNIELLLDLDDDDDEDSGPNVPTL